MSKSSTKLIALFGILLAVIAIVATVITAVVLTGKRKNKEELEHYLDCAIQ
ncbi:MAG: hypothetical protein R3Y35_08630 [Clostridia bacterium]